MSAPAWLSSPLAKVLLGFGILAAVAVASALAYAKWGAAGLIPGGALAAEGARRLKAGSKARRDVEAEREGNEARTLARNDATERRRAEQDAPAPESRPTPEPAEGFTADERRRLEALRRDL